METTFAHFVLCWFQGTSQENFEWANLVNLNWINETKTNIIYELHCMGIIVGFLQGKQFCKFKWYFKHSKCPANTYRLPSKYPKQHVTLLYMQCNSQNEHKNEMNWDWHTINNHKPMWLTTHYKAKLSTKRWKMALLNHFMLHFFYAKFQLYEWCTSSQNQKQKPLTWLISVLQFEIFLSSTQQILSFHDCTTFIEKDPLVNRP